MLNTIVAGRPLVYFNSASTALKPRPVLEAMEGYYTEDGVNVFRGVDTVSYRATQAFEASRQKVAEFLQAPSARCIVFTRNTTASLNLVARSYGELIVQEGDEVVVTMGEHHANFIPWQQLAKRKGARLVAAPLDEDGRLTPDALASVLTERTRLVAVAHMSNVMGAHNDLRGLAEVTHRTGAKLIVDGAQGIVHEAARVQDWDLDFYAFSGHKLYGPTGVGVLYGKPELLQAMPPIDFGGEMIDEVRFEDSTFADPPHRFEAGTPMIAEVIGLGAAIDFVQQIGYSAMQERIVALTKRLRDGLQTIDGLRCYNPNNSHSGIVSFNYVDVHAHDAASVFDQAGISLRAGQHCNQPTMEWLGEAAVLRASLSFFNTEEEVDYFIEIARKAGNFLDVLF